MPIYKRLLFSFLILTFIIFICYTFAIAQGNETERTITTSTGMGDITLKLQVYNNEDDPNTPLDDPQKYVSFIDCSVLSPEDPNFLPLPLGDFHYGLWRARITLTSDFDREIHSIFMEIYFPGRIDPLNSEYWTQEYNNDNEKAEWKEFSHDLFLPDVTESKVTIRLSDSRPSELRPLYIEIGFGDRDSREGFIDHVGGLLWPIPGEGRCFIESIR